MSSGGGVVEHPAGASPDSAASAASAVDACAALCAVADRLARGPEMTPRRYLVQFGRAGAGIPSGPGWILVAAAGGRNTVRGRGFRPEFDDGSSGQARHFAGIVATAARIGVGPTRWLSIHLRRDGLDTPDGRLTELALDFAARIRSGTLAPTAAAAWLHPRLCAP